MPQLEPIGEPESSIPAPAAGPVLVPAEQSVLPDSIVGEVSPVLEHIKSLVNGQQPPRAGGPELEALPADTSGLEGADKRVADLRSINTKLYQENQRLKQLARVDKILDKVEAAAGMAPAEPPAPKPAERPPETSFMSQKEFDDLERANGFIAAQQEYMRRYEADKAGRVSREAEVARVEKSRNESVDYMQKKYPTYINDSAGFTDHLLKQVVSDMQTYGSAITNETVNAAVERFASDRNRLEESYRGYLSEIGDTAPVQSIEDSPINQEKLSMVPMQGNTPARRIDAAKPAANPTPDGFMTLIESMEAAMPSRRVGAF